MADHIGSGFKPHQLRRRGLGDPPAKRRAGDADPGPAGPAPEAPGAAPGPGAERTDKVVRDVLELTHRPAAEGESVRFKKTDARAAFARQSAVALAEGRLSIGGQSFPVSKAAAKALTLAAPNQAAIAAVFGGLESSAPTLISAAPGSGAAFTTRWLLSALGRPHEVVRLSASTSLDVLVGALRPDEDKKLRVNDGPLTRCIRNGGVFVVDGLEKADPQVLATLKALAKGAKWFHHPVSGEPIEVSRDFQLVMIADRTKRVPASLAQAANVAEIDPYGEKDHARILAEQHGLPEPLAARLARFNQRLVKASAAGEVDFGREFPLAFELLGKVGARLAKKRNPSDQDLQRALWGVYGARLAREDHRDAFAALLADLGPPVELKAKRSQDPTFIHTPRVDRALALAEDALAAKEPVLLHAAGQSGATRLVLELAQRRGQEVTSVVGHSGTDAQALMETPVFDAKGELYLKPGRVAEALVSGKLLYVDHLDQMTREQQNAFFQLQHASVVRVLEKGKLVEKPVHPDARVVLSTTEGKVRGRQAPSAQDRATVTEIRLDRPSVEELVSLIPSEVAQNHDLWDVVYDVVTELGRAEHPDVFKLQRLVDFSRASLALAEVLPHEEAVVRAAKLVFGGRASCPTLERLDEAVAARPDAQPVWMKLLGLTQRQVDQRLAKTKYRITPSMTAHLDALALAYRLGRPVRAIGPASSGKTVLGAVFAALLDKQNVRVNFSSATESRDLMGGLGPQNAGGKTVFKHVEGPAMRAAELESVLTADEWNLSRQGQMVLKSALDHRRQLIDAEADVERSFASSFFYAAQNENDPKTGRYEPPPEVADCMFTIVVGAKPLDEKVDIVASQCGLPRPELEKLAAFYGDIEILAREGRLGSGVGPITATERDMLKAARTAEHLIARDGVQDPAAQRALLGREVLRLVRDSLLDSGERATVLKLVQKHFGKDVTPPPRPAAIERVVVKQGKENVEVLQIGAARVPIRKKGEDPELDALIPSLERVRAPVGEQLEFLESVLLALELGQPLAVVGNTGTGKTMLMRYLAHHLNLPMREQPFHADMTEEHLFGTTVVTKDGAVEFRYGMLPECIKKGMLYVGDEPTTLKNDTRESLNPVTERSEIQIAQKRPPETIKAEDWHPDFRFVVTTNGDDIREDGFSEAEASRYRLLGLRELESREDLVTIALRDHAVQTADDDYAPPARNAENRERLGAALKGLVDGRSGFGRLLGAAVKSALEGGAAPELLQRDDVPVLRLDAALERTLTDALNVFSNAKKDAPLRAVLHQLLEVAQRPEGAAARIGARVQADLLSADLRALAEGEAVVGGLLANPEEAEAAAELFVELRALQKKAGEPGLTPLTPRIFSTFMDLFVELRDKRGLGGAVLRAAELTLWPKLPRAERKRATALLFERFGQVNEGGKAIGAPHQGDRGVFFGETFVGYGEGRPWKASNERFPMTPARCKNLALVADAMEMGRGRPVSLTDDANGEAVETLREYGRLTGKQVTVVSLPPNVDLENLIEKLVVSQDGKAKGGFEPELQQIAQAVRDGHTLVLRGCGNVPSTKLERLNSLGDGRQGLKLPLSGEWLSASADFRMVLMRAPDGVHRYSAALENRLLSPPLTTQEAETTQAALENRAAELAAVVRERTGISDDAANKLGVFHTYLNELIREGKFASGRAVGAFLNRDAEAVGRRLAWLEERRAVEDESETLLELVMEVYGERFGSEKDREQLRASAERAFGAEGGRYSFDSEVQPSPQLTRVGEWVVPRDPRGVRAGVPGPEAMLPPTEKLGQLLQRVVAAAQFDEVLHLAGNERLAKAAVDSLARLTTSTLLEVEGNEELSEAYLFGGLIQNQKTGEFEPHEGLIFQAQREGATLVIRNASTVPPDVLTKLVEIAATGHVQRVKDGKLEVQPRAFRLILQTSEGDPPLPRELASLSTKVRCADVEAQDDLRALIAHQLAGVPGADELASALEGFSREAEALLATESQSGRQALRFDGTRALLAAENLRARVAGEGWSVEEALADVVTRLYLRPAEGLEIAGALKALVEERLTEPLAGVLVLSAVEPVDLIANPEVGALRLDYGRVAPLFGTELLRAGADGLRAAAGAGSSAAAKDVLGALLEGGLLPEKILARAQSALEQLGNRKLGADDAKALQELAKQFERSAAEEGPFAESSLAFVRGARVWDLEFRLGIVARYEAVFSALAKAGSPLAEARLADLAGVRERFDAAEAVGGLTGARAQVVAAIERYERRQGEEDPQLRAVYKKLLSTWDLVSTAPIFRNQALPELGELERLLFQLEEAHEERGAPAVEVAGLAGAFRQASKTLEGIRIAEQSAELRRGRRRAEESVESLVVSLEGEVKEIRRLEEARRAHEKLDAGRNQIAGTLQADTFLRLDLGAESVDRPVMRGEAELQAEAARRAKEQVAVELEGRRVQAYQRLGKAVEAAAAPPAARFFENYDLASADVGLSAEAKAPKKSAGEVAHARELAGLEAWAEARSGALEGQLYAELKAGEERRARELYEQRVKQRASEVAARVNRSAQELSSDLSRIGGTLGLADAAPELFAELQAAREALAEAGSNARTWAGQMMGFAAEAGRQMLAWASFGFFGRRKVAEAPAGLDLEQAKRQAAAALAKVDAWAKARQAELPDFREVGAHRAATESISDQLLAADSLGELAAKYTKLAAVFGHQEDADVRRYLNAVLGQLANERQVRELLVQVAAFCESADLLSAEAKHGGVAVELAPAVDAIMRAAETVRTQSLAEGAYKSAMKALRRALGETDELAKAAGGLPPVLVAVREEMLGLETRIRELVEGRGGAIQLETAAFKEMLENLGQTAPERDVVAAAGDAFGVEAGPKVDRGPVEPNAAVLERYLERRQRAEGAVELSPRPARSTKLTLIDVDFGRARALELPAVAKKGEAQGAAEAALGEAVLAAARGLEGKAAAREGQLERTAAGLRELFDELEQIGAAGALDHWRGRLGQVQEALAAVADAGEEGFRGFARQVRSALDGLREVAAGLAGFEQVPEAVSAQLAAAVESARTLEAAFDGERFRELARDWAAGALVAATAAQGAVGELILARGEEAREPGRAGAVLGDLERLFATLAQDAGPLGGWSRLTLLSHAHQRLAAVQAALPEHHREQAVALGARLLEQAAKLAAVAEGAEVERSAADVLEAMVDLAAEVVKKKDLDQPLVDRYAALAELAWGLIGPTEGALEDRVALATRAVDAAEQLAKGNSKSARIARELSLSFGGLRSGMIDASLARSRAALRTEASGYLDGVREARLALGDARVRFLEYDPLAGGAPLAERARELARAVVDAGEVMRGPAAVVLAQEITGLAEALEARAEGGGPVAAEARRLADELDPLRRQAAHLGEPADAPERFTRMLELFEARLSGEGGVKEPLLAWAREAGEALLGLMRAPDEELGARLQALEAEHFAALLPKPKAEVQRVVMEPGVAEVKSRVKALLERGGAAGGEAGAAEVRVDVGGARRGLALAGGLHVNAPAEESGERRPGGPGQGAAVGGKAGGKVGRDAKLKVEGRADLAEGKATERSERLDVVSISTAGLSAIKKRMNQAIDEAAVKAEGAAEEVLSEYAQFIEAHSDLVDHMAQVLRQHQGLESVLVIDQSHSTRDHYGDSQIIEQERAALAIILAAHMRAERNCAVVGFGSRAVGDTEVVSQVGRVSIFVHKPMSERLDQDVADYVYGITGQADGWTDLIEPFNVALGQFTERANNKMIHVLTDAQLGNAWDVRRHIDNLRANGVGVAVQGFGAAQHVEMVAGEFGQHVDSFASAVRGAAELFVKAVVDNAGRFVGQMKAGAQGIGVAAGQAPLAAAPSPGPMDTSLSISEPLEIPGDPAEVYGGRGPRREQTNVVDRAKYDRALKELERQQKDVLRSKSYKDCLQEVRALKVRHEREGVIEALRESIGQSLPKTRTSDWERKQLSGPLFDEQQLPMYIAGLAQGVPVMRIFKRRRPVEDTKATVVLAIDESSSMGDSEKMRANLEALLAYGDALRAADPDIKIAVVGFSDKVRLHAGFEQDWNDELKAHLLHQVQGTYDATDDERGAVEALGLLRMTDAEVGQVVAFGDGQGMPGAEKVMKAGAQEGFAFLTVGVGPDCKAVSRFGAHGLYVRNLAQLANKLLPASLRAWEEAGRLV